MSTINQAVFALMHALTQVINPEAKPRGAGRAMTPNPLKSS